MELFGSGLGLERTPGWRLARRTSGSSRSLRRRRGRRAIHDAPDPSLDVESIISHPQRVAQVPVAQRAFAGRRRPTRSTPPKLATRRPTRAPPTTRPPKAASMLGSRRCASPSGARGDHKPSTPRATTRTGGHGKPSSPPWGFSKRGADSGCALRSVSARSRVRHERRSLSSPRRKKSGVARHSRTGDDRGMARGDPRCRSPRINPRRPSCALHPVGSGQRSASARPRTRIERSGPSKPPQARSAVDEPVS